MSGRGGSGVLLALVLAGLAAPACSTEKSYAVVTIKMAEGELSEIAQFLVYTTHESAPARVLYYPQSPSGRYRINTTESIDLSVSFDADRTGTVKIGIEARDTVGNVLGYGEAQKTIDPGHRFDLAVALVRGARAPIPGSGDASVGGDAGGGSDGSSDGFVPPSECEATQPATCGANRTCVVNCSGSNPVGQCAAAGTGKDGDYCVVNRDCEPGTQCFTYACAAATGMPATGVGGVCRKFCKTDPDCGTGGLCNRTVSCGQTETSNKFCSQSCDPRGAAMCKSGLRCLLFAMEQAACDCPEPSRSKTDGQTCVDTADCAPGLLCIAMNTPTPVCRPICKLTDMDCPADRTCAQLTMPRYVTWGACVPRVGG